MRPAGHHGTMAMCDVCGIKLVGRQRNYCSPKCKNRSTNARCQSYVAQQHRGRLRKLKLIDRMGGCCTQCGYSRNFAALEFHHRDAYVKSFALDLRSLSNRRWRAVLQEATKCVLLCSNCHAEVHNPECQIEKSRAVPGSPRSKNEPA
jgi:hypothetical protein